MSLWTDAAGILETAGALGDSASSDLGILVDESNHVRIVNAVGWNLASLRQEYGASVAYTVKRTGTSVSVEAQSPSEQCTLKKSLDRNPLARWTNGVPRHLLQPSASLLTKA